MAVLLIDMPSGVAGDMLLAALLACGGDRERLERDLLGLGIGAVHISASPVMAGPLAATRIEVLAPQEALWAQAPLAAKPGHIHRPYRDIRSILERAALPERARNRAQAAFRLLAEAEGSVHGTPADDVEFHEVGSLDAIADVVGVCLLLEQLDVERVLASPLVPGHGTVTCAHGRMPVPVPAVARILELTRAPVLALARQTGELTTPTGAALVCSLTERYLDGGGQPPGVFRVRRSGFGAGHKEIAGLVNAVRCTLLEASGTNDGDEVCEIACQIDDATGEDLALALADLLAAGALDAWLTPVLMKKGRPGHLLSLLCRPADQERLADLVLVRTPSIGLRLRSWQRRILARHETEVQVDGQRIRLKTVDLPGGGTRTKPESDDVAAAARALGLSLAEIRRRALSR